MFLNIFHLITFSINDGVKSYCKKIVPETLQLEFSDLLILIHILLPNTMSSDKNKTNMVYDDKHLHDPDPSDNDDTML